MDDAMPSEIKSASSHRIDHLSDADALASLNSTPEGLSNADAHRRLEIFLETADMLFHIHDGRAELACSSEGPRQAAGDLGKLGTRPRRTHRAANKAERKGSQQRPDHRDTSNHLV